MGSCCLQVLLLASLLVLGISGGFAAFWAYFNFPSGEKLPPEIQNTSNGDLTKEYKDYVMATTKHSDYYGDSRLYVIIPGGVNAITSAVLLMACIFSRKVFASTTILYSAVSLWAVNLAVTIWFQVAATDFLENFDDFSPFFFWILSFHVGQLVMLSFQILVAGLELRWQKTTWPTINFSHLFTPSTVLLAATMTLAIYSVITFDESPLRRGIITKYIDGYWNDPKIKVPDYYVFPVVVTLTYGAVVNSQNLLCHLLGNSHSKLMGVTNLLSGILYCCVATISSPAILFIITGYSPLYFVNLMGFALGGGLLSIIHGILCLAQPDRMMLPPKIVKDIAMQCNFSELSLAPFSTVSSSFNSFNRVFPEVKSKFSRHLNYILLVLSLLSLVLGSIGASDYGRPKWSIIIMIAGDTAILCRLIPSILNQIYMQQEEISPLQMMLTFIFEASLTFVGAVGGFCSWSSWLIADGVFKLIIFLITIKSLPSTWKGATTIMSEYYIGQREEERNALVPENDEAEGSESENENITPNLV